LTPPGRRRGTSNRWDAGAIVVGGDFQGLGIVRSLGRYGIPVCVIDDERSVSRFSRYTTYAARVPTLRDDDSTMEALDAAVDRFGLHGWVVFPTRDETVAALSRHATQLRRKLRIPTADWQAVQVAWDKRNLYRVARELRVPAPQSWSVAYDGTVQGDDIRFPVAIKPAIKEHFIYATKAKAWRANDEAELAARIAEAKQFIDPRELIIQDLVPGDGRQQYAYCAFFKDGKAVASMVVRRRRQHPPEFGRASTFVETVDSHDLHRPSLKLLEAIGYYGLVELEYKLDPRDGVHRLLDFNARTWGYHTLGYGAGVDFPYIVFRDQLGLPVGEYRARPGVKWIRLTTDLPTALVELKAGRLDWPAYLQTLFGGFDVEAVFSRKDPLPGLAEIALVPYLIRQRGF
jgi:D-aspartate ligase